MSLLNNLNLNKYSYEFTRTETTAGDTLIYLANRLSYKCRNELNIYKKINCQPTKSNIFYGSHIQTFIYGSYSF